MAHDSRTDGRDERTNEHGAGIWRRRVLSAGAGLGATVFAGCLSETSGDQPADGGDHDETDGTGSNFRLLVSDQPADIGDFDRLDVSFDRARVFDGGESEDEDGDEANQTDDEDGDDSGTESSDGGDDVDTESSDEDGQEDESGDDEDGQDDESDDAEDSQDGVTRRQGYYVLDLDGATVDLTEVVGEKAIPVFEGGLSEGTYEKLELYVAEIEGIVDGEQVEVTVPSEKLQITHSFEVRADDPVDFVFDINVVKRGRQDSYNLQPVISESGVAGKDVDVEEIGDGRGDDDPSSGGEESGDGDGSADGDDSSGGDGSEGEDDGDDDGDDSDDDTSGSDEDDSAEE